MRTSMVTLVASLMFFGTAAVASPITEHSQSMGVRFSYADTDDVGKNTDLSLSWSTFVLDDSIELGLSLVYVEDDPEFGISTDGNSIGPYVQYNFQPDNNVNPFLGFGIANVGGDLGDFFDYEYAFSVGVNVFVGESASLNVSLGKSTLVGADNVQDLDTTGLFAGMSFYFGKKK